MTQAAEQVQRELAWLRREVARTAGMTDAERIQVLEDLWQTSEAIQATKSAEQLDREEHLRRVLAAPGLQRYSALAARHA